MKLLGVQIANGFSPEARVHASLLGSRGDLFDAMVLMHDSPADRASSTQFATTSKANVETVDTGWRRSEGGRGDVARRARFLLRFIGALNEMTRVARTYDPDVIYSCQQQWDCRAATALARRLRKPQVIHLHSVVTHWLRKQPLERLLTCDRVVTVSDFIRAEALRHGVRPDRVTTVLNSVPPLASSGEDARRDVRAEMELPQGAAVVGIVARICAGKGHQDTIEAFDRVSVRFPEAHLLIVGDGPIEDEIKQFAASTSAANRIRFTGRRSDVPRILSALDIFIHPSLQEACSLAVMEASVAGLPVVAYAEGGTPELILDGKTGLLAPARDRDKLAGALAALLADRKMSAKYGASGRERMLAKFRPEQASEVFASLLDSVAGSSLRT